MDINIFSIDKSFKLNWKLIIMKDIFIFQLVNEEMKILLQIEYLFYLCILFYFFIFSKKLLKTLRIYLKKTVESINLPQSYLVFCFRCVYFKTLSGGSIIWNCSQSIIASTPNYYFRHLQSGHFNLSCYDMFYFKSSPVI